MANDKRLKIKISPENKKQIEEMMNIGGSSFNKIVNNLLCIAIKHIKESENEEV